MKAEELWHREKWQTRVLLGTSWKQWLNVKVRLRTEFAVSSYCQWSDGAHHPAATQLQWTMSDAVTEMLHATWITRIITHSFQMACFIRYSPKEWLNKGLEPKYLLLEWVANVMWDQYFCWIFSLFMKLLGCVTLHFIFFLAKMNIPVPFRTELDKNTKMWFKNCSKAVLLKTTAVKGIILCWISIF